MSGSTGYTYSQTGQIVPTQSLAYLVQQLKAAQAAQTAQATAAQNQAAQAPAAGGGTQTAPQTTQAAGAPSAATGGGGSPAGAVAAPAAPAAPQMTPEQQTQAIESYLTGTAYPDIQQQIMAAYQREVEGQPSKTGLSGVASSLGLGSPGSLGGATGDIQFLTGLANPMNWFMDPFKVLGGLLFGGEKAPPLTASDFPWVGGSKGYPTGAGGLGGLVSLPDPSTGYGGATEKLAQQLGGGVAEAYPWGAGAPYTPGSGIYQATPQMFPTDTWNNQPLPGTTQAGGNPAFFMPGTDPNTIYQTDYFGNVTGGPFNMSGVGTAPAGDQPLGFGAKEPEWLQQAFGQAATNLGWAPGGQSDVGFAPAWGTPPTTQQLSGWGITSTTPDRSGGGQ